MEAADPEQVLRGVVRRVTFRNPENGYTVFQLTIDDSVDQVTVVGNFVETSVGSHVVVRGIYKEHPKFGRQLAAYTVTATQPETAEGLIAYLGSGIIKGVGEKTAERIIQALGTEAISIIHREPERLAAIQGVGPSKARLIIDTLSAQAGMGEVLRFLLTHHVSQNLAKKIHDHYGNRSVEILSRDPYILARASGIRGIGFLRADQIAMNLGLKKDSEQRIRAGLFYALEKALDEGHCFLSKEQLFQRAQMLLELGESIDLETPLHELVDEELCIEDNEAIYLRQLYQAEEFVASFVAARVGTPCKKEIAPETVDRVLAQAEEGLQVHFSREQRDAVLAAATKSFLLITGGPGCGKTTIIRALAKLFKESRLRLALAAPTGRAAQRMAQVCELPASTIHRLLKFNPSDGQFVHGLHDPLPIDALIIDEASMIDLQLAEDLFAAVPPDARVILVGDKDQLPSVGPGRVFGDLLSLHELTTISLSQLFRRSGESSINAIAHAVNAGLVPEIPAPDGKTKADAYFLEKRDAAEAGLLVESLVADQIGKKFGFETKDISVLTPTNRGPLGTLALNQRLQAKLNPELDSEQEIMVGETIFRVGDRVCQRVNNYQIDPVGVFNGDVGQIFGVDRRTKTLLVEMWDGRLVKYNEAEMRQLALAYAVTVHRSQGSEIPCVVLTLHESHYALLERQLIYTAITRAKKLLIVVGSKRSLQIACKRASTAKRCTRLRERIRRKLGS